MCPQEILVLAAREIGFMFGMYKKLNNEFTGVLTGKGASWGGSLIRPEATGYGTVYFAQNMLQRKNDSFEGKKVVISGAGNVAQYAAEKAIELGATVLTLSDSGGYIYDSEGINTEKLKHVMYIKNEKRGRIGSYIEKYPNAKYIPGERPWSIKCDIALPCATQNELNGAEAKTWLKTDVCVFLKEQTCLLHQKQFRNSKKEKFYSLQGKQVMQEELQHQV